jgi:hypothetical protein
MAFSGVEKLLSFNNWNPKQRGEEGATIRHSTMSSVPLYRRAGSSRVCPRVWGGDQASEIIP